MISPQVNPAIEALDGPNRSMGLGWFLGSARNQHWFGHSGVNTGFVAEIVMMDSGQGAVVMANNWSFPSQVVLRYLLNNIAREYGWAYRYSPFTPWPYADTIVLATDMLRGPAAAIRRYEELKAVSGQREADGTLRAVWSSDPPDYLPNEWDLLGIAQVLADPAHLPDAIEILKVETRDYPNFWLGYHRLGDLYERSGETALAIESYQRSAQLNSRDRGAIAALARLRHAAPAPH